MKFSNPFNRDQITSKTEETKKLPDLRGPLTARGACNAILPAVRQIDQEFKLTFVGSGQGINHEGRAYAWDFFFEFPRLRGQGVFFIHLCPDEGDDEGPWCMDIRVRPLGKEPAQPALPLEFRDSVEAVQALAEQGVDWIAGDSHSTLSAQILTDGAIVWHTTCWDKAYQTPFA